MKKAKMVLRKLLNPPKRLLIPMPMIVFAALIFLFANRLEESAGIRYLRHVGVLSCNTCCAGSRSFQGSKGRCKAENIGHGIWRAIP